MINSQFQSYSHRIFVIMVGIILILWNGPPVDLIPVLEADSRGLFSSRHCIDPGFVP